MRYTEIKDTVTDLKKTKALDKVAIRKAIKVLRNPKKTTLERFNSLWTPFEGSASSINIGYYFQGMKTISRKPWSYVADRMEQVLLAA